MKADTLPIITATYVSPIGNLLLAAQGATLTGLWIQGQKYFPADLPAPGGSLPILTEAMHWLDRYFAGETPSPSELRLAPVGSDFRQQVWRILCRIPYGQVTTYGEIARALAKQNALPSMSAQAVGGAIGHNPISIIIPCHRVIGTNGALTGYAGGIERKQYLLTLEHADLTNIYRHIQ